MALHTDGRKMDAEAFTEANRAYFDDLAARYSEKPWQKKLIAQVTAEVRDKLDFIGFERADQDSNIGRDVRLLDYACGTGAISMALRPYITSTTGVDISQSMTKIFNENLSSDDEAARQLKSAKAYVGDLLSDSSTSSTQSSHPNFDSSEFHDFDIAAVGAALHHFADPAAAVRRLGRRLKIGGVLLIIDFIGGGVVGDASHDHGHGHGHHAHSYGEQPNGDGHENADEAWARSAAAHTINQHGFSREGMQKLFDAAASYERESERVTFNKFGWSVMEEEAEMIIPKKKEDSQDGLAEEVVVRRKIFLARATRVD